MKRARCYRLGFALAETYARMSKDPSTKVGCAILAESGTVLAGGFNGLPRGVKDQPNRYSVRPTKYLWVEHAERNSIFNAARHGIALEGSALFVTSLPPCARCMRAIIQAGIRQVHYVVGEVPDRWKDDVLVAKEMCVEAGVRLQGHPATVLNAET